MKRLATASLPRLLPSLAYFTSTMTQKKSRGFTLLELLAAAAITAALTALVLTAMSDALDQWNRQAGRRGAEAAARTALDQIEQDLQGAIFRSDTGVWLAANVLPDTSLSGQWQPAAVPANAKPDNTNRRTLNLGAPEPADARHGVAGVWLRFFTSKQDADVDTASLSAPVAVGCQLIRRNVTSSSISEQRHMLFRAEVRRTRTSGGTPGAFEAGYNLDPAAMPATPYMTPSGTSGNPGNLIRPPLGAALADNVIDFGVRLYVRNNGNLRLIFPAAPAAEGGAPVEGRATSAMPPSPETEHLARCTAPAADDYYRHVFPDMADVTLRILTDEGARLIAAFEAGRIQAPAGVAPADHWWNLAEAHSLVFTRRIVIPGRPGPAGT